MGNIVQYSVNITMEATIILVLLIMLITLFWQKKYLVIAVPFIYLVVTIILLTIVQITTWAMLILNVPAKYGEMPMRIVFVLDFVLSYNVSAMFYYYVENLAVEGYRRIGVAFKPKKNINAMILLWGGAASVVYTAALFVPSLYHIENGIEVFSIPAYIVLHIISKFACICSLIFINHHKKVIGKHEYGISSVFIILISLFVIVDELCEVCIGHVLIAVAAFLLYVSIDLQKGLMLERQEKEITEWKTQIMLSQMQPHFLYNVLTTISGMCEMEKANEARDVVNHFADYFRTNLESLSRENTIPFEKELEHIKTYLWLEKVRFEDELNVCYEIGATDFVVPSLTVQPIVENAVKHGILPKDDTGTVTIRTYEKDQEYVISIEDDGIGFDINEVKNDNRTHVGLENVSKRLKIICNGTFEIKSEIGKGTIVTMHIPKGD